MDNEINAGDYVMVRDGVGIVERVDRRPNKNIASYGVILANEERRNRFWYSNRSVKKITEEEYILGLLKYG